MWAAFQKRLSKECGHRPRPRKARWPGTPRPFQTELPAVLASHLPDWGAAVDRGGDPEGIPGHEASSLRGLLAEAE